MNEQEAKELAEQLGGSAFRAYQQRWEVLVIIDEFNRRFYYTPTEFVTDTSDPVSTIACGVILFFVGLALVYRFIL